MRYTGRTRALKLYVSNLISTPYPYITMDFITGCEFRETDWHVLPAQRCA